MNGKGKLGNRPSRVADPIPGGSVLKACSIGVVAAAALLFVLGMFKEPAFISMALIVFAVAALPLLGQRRYPVFHPSVIALGLIMAFVLPKAYWLSVNGLDSHEARVTLLLWAPSEALMSGLFALVVAYFAFSVGSLSATRAFPRPPLRIFRGPTQLHLIRAKLVLVVIVATSVIGLLLYLQTTGFGLTPQKRGAVVEGETGLLTLTYLWWRLALTGRLGFVLGLFWLHHAKEHRWEHSPRSGD